MTIEEHASISRLAAALGDLVTNSYIDELAKSSRLPAGGSSKAKRLACMLGEARMRGWTKRRIEQLAYQLTMEGYRRFAAKQVSMTHVTVDRVVKEMKVLGLDPADLASKKWRKDLPASDGTATAPGQYSTAARPTMAANRIYASLAAEIQAYSLPACSVSPQARGKRLEAMLEEILDAEGLAPRGPLRCPGEEIDRTFSLLHSHYLLEAKWEASPIGFPAVRDFIGKVSRKAEGTFGVFLSMSGFVKDINLSATHGQRLNCVGLTGIQLMDVIEGRSTWSQLVTHARRTASERSAFLATTHP